MDTKMAGIIAPTQNTTGPKKLGQSLPARTVLGDGGGRGARLSGEGRPSRAHGGADETELGRKILAIHEADERGIYVKPVLNIIDVIFYRATADLPGYTQVQKSPY